jgi:GNAT superfamily N-acetyltransferase
MVHIRSATTEDVDAFIRLNKAFNDVELTFEKAVSNLASAADKVILAEIDEPSGLVVAGFACVLIHQRVCYPTREAEITELFVDEAHRGKGIGVALMLHAEQLCRQANVDSIAVCTGFDNAIAQRLYLKLGYVNDDIRLLKEL